MNYNFETLTKAIVLNKEVENKTQDLLNSDPIFINPEKYFGVLKDSKTDFIKLQNELNDEDGFKLLGLELLCALETQKDYKDIGISEKIYIDTFKCFSRFIEESYELYGKYKFDRFYWLNHQLNANLFRIGELEDLFLKKNGWQAESNAAILLSGLGISQDLHEKQMKELKESDKVKVLLARALFGEPDILLLDEPTNGLDLESKHWLEEFLIDFKNTVIVISHDRHFLNKICTHMVDIDYEKITMFAGNYDFWYESSQLIQKQMRESNKKKEEKIAELQDFIRRFSANASKSKQATSRKKSLEKIVLDDIKPSSRKYPFINFEPERYLGKEVIHLDHVYKSIDGVEVLKNIRLTIKPGDKIALIGNNELAKTTLLRIIMGIDVPDRGEVKVGTTVIRSYYPKNYDDYFKSDMNMIEWLKQYSSNQEDTFVRSFLGRMLFSGEESLKKINVLSGGEKVRCMLSKIMLEHGNLLLLDEPTNHLDMESITALDEGLKRFNGCVVFATFDQHLIDTIATRIIDIKEDGSYLDKEMSYEEYIAKYGNEQ